MERYTKLIIPNNRVQDGDNMSCSCTLFYYYRKLSFKIEGKCDIEDESYKKKIVPIVETILFLTGYAFSYTPTIYVVRLTSSEL